MDFLRLFISSVFFIEPGHEEDIVIVRCLSNIVTAPEWKALICRGSLQLINMNGRWQR